MALSLLLLSLLLKFRCVFSATIIKNFMCGCMDTLFIGLSMVFTFASPKFNKGKLLEDSLDGV